MKKTFRRTHWGRLKLFQVPCDVFRDEQLVIRPNALAVLLALYETVRTRRCYGQDGIVRFKFKQKTLSERTGFSKNRITAATKELEVRGFLKRDVSPRRKRGEFGVSYYVLCDSSNAKPLMGTGGTAG